MHRFATPVLPIVVLCIATVLSTSALAQLAAFKHFKEYPKTGQWQQELVGYRDGKPMGAPVTTTRCTGPADPAMTAMAADFAKGMTQACTTRVLVDKETLAESETVCKVGAGVQTLHMLLRPIDDRTLASETRSTMPGTPETVMKSKVTYLGPCPAGAAEAQSKPSAADCAELAEMRKQNEAAGGAGQCAQLPPQYRPQCESGLRMMAGLEQRCK